MERRVSITVIGVKSLASLLCLKPICIVVFLIDNTELSFVLTVLESDRYPTLKL